MHLASSRVALKEMDRRAARLLNVLVNEPTAYVAPTTASLAAHT